MEQSIFEQRVSGLQGRLRTAGVRGALLTAPISIRYLTGLKLRPWERLIALIIGPDGAGIVVPELDRRYVSTHPALRGIEVEGVADGVNPFPIAAALIQQIAGERRVAVERASISMAFADRLQHAGMTIVPDDAGTWVMAMRLVKSPAEIAAMRQAAALADTGVAAVAAALRAGARERDLAQVAEAAIKSAGAEALAFGVSVLSGEQSGHPHGNTGDRVLKDGEFVIVDMGAINDGYCSDITRTFVVGGEAHSTDRQRNIYSAVRAAQQAAVATVRPGIPVSEVDAAARAVVTERGLGDAFIHRVGHGIGMEAHEPPSLAPGESFALRAGMVVTIEPGAYLGDEGGVRIEDMVLVTDDGTEVLTKTRKLFTH